MSWYFLRQQPQFSLWETKAGWLFGLFCKNEYGDPITHLPIDSDRIAGVQFSFQLIDMPVDTFVFSMYFPSTNYLIDEYNGCLPLLWALFEIYCDSGLIIILDDLNGSLGLMEGSRPRVGPQNERGKLLLEFMENFTFFAAKLRLSVHWSPGDLQF